VARFEPLARFNDPFVQAAALSKSPALKTFLISSYTAKVVLVEFDKDVRAQIDQVVMKWKGDVNYAFDGVTAFNQSHLLITRNSGRTTSLVKCVKLLSEVHVTETEVEESVRAIQEDIALTPGKTVASVSVDNAAASMAEQVTAALAEVPETKKALVTRDPSHCLDLGPKDLAKLADCIKKPLDDANKLVQFLNTDRIAGIQEEMEEGGLTKSLESSRRALFSWPCSWTTAT